MECPRQRSRTAAWALQSMNLSASFLRVANSLFSASVRVAFWLRSRSSSYRSNLASVFWLRAIFHKVPSSSRSNAANASWNSDGASSQAGGLPIWSARRIIPFNGRRVTSAVLIRACPIYFLNPMSPCQHLGICGIFNAQALNCSSLSNQAVRTHLTDWG